LVRVAKRRVVRALRVAGGFALLIAGVAMLALPGPGWITIAAGLALLSTEFEWARRWLEKLKSAGRRIGGRRAS